MKVRKAVITAGGWGTRFLPLTRSQPKEMLPIVNKPLIHYAVEEAINSGIEQIIMVTALGKNAIEDYFDRSFELEYFLEQKGEIPLLKEMREISSMVNICYIRQKEQLGLGHAVAATKQVVGDEPFAVILPDDIIYGQTPVLRQMLDVYDEYGGGVIAVEEIEAQDSVKYGIIDPRPVSGRTYEILGLVEKPAPEVAPSNLGIVGRYILPPEIFDAIATTKPGVKGEIQITDAIQQLINGQKLYACRFDGERHDAGNPLGWLKATVAFALGHPDIGPAFRDYLQRFRK
jgi:UTP--glucose-1-phosphate uridylyltransferase